MKITTRFCSFSIIFLLGSFFSSCNNAAEDEVKLKGKFVNQTYLRTIPDSIPGLVSAYCYEMDFISDDSVKVLYGFEEATLGYKKKGNHYELVNALRDKNMPFSFNDDGTLILTDSTWNERSENSTFSKSGISADWKFDNYINQKMIAGTYLLYKDDKPASQKIIFNTDGTVTGLQNFKSYKICYSGDCVAETYPISNNITFTDDKNVTSVFAFDIDRKNKTLKINKIESPIPDTKGERAIKEIAFDLRQ